MRDKVSPGQKVKAVPYETWNSMIAAGQAWKDGELGRSDVGGPVVRRTDSLKVKNNTGAARRRGEVITLGSLATSQVEMGSVLLESVDTKRGERFGIYRYGTPDESFGEAHISGIAFAIVDVASEDHRSARVPDDNTHVLQSCDYGPIEILFAPDATGEQDCLIRIRESTLPIFKTPSGGIPARSSTTCGSADCTPYTIDDAGELVELKTGATSREIEIFNPFGSDIGGSVYITAKEIHGVLIVDAEDCG